MCASLDVAGLAKIDGIAERKTLPASAHLAHEGDDAPYVYGIRSGCLRLYRVLPDGRRLIVDFAFRGAFVIPAGHEWDLAIDAVEDVSVCRFRADALGRLSAERPELAAAMFAHITRSLSAARSHLLMLGRRDPRERVAAFLLSLPSETSMERHDRRTSAPDLIRLPMTRGDMADYLGLTIESVSRAITHMVVRGVIARSGGGVAVLDLARLSRAAGVAHVKV